MGEGQHFLVEKREIERREIGLMKNGEGKRDAANENGTTDRRQRLTKILVFMICIFIALSIRERRVIRLTNYSMWWA
ncbi:hypothetical protein P8452_42581 [Trifolium repens]|nr:hypothetical protein P8452_42581 [Trifolium repens]